MFFTIYLYKKNIFMPAKDHFNTIVVTKEQIEEALEEMLVELNYRVNAEDMHDTLDALTKFADYCVPENIIAKNKENNIISIIKGDTENIDTIYSSIRRIYIKNNCRQRRNRVFQTNYNK